MTDRLRVGIIGCGVGRAHARGYARHPRAEIVAVADINPDRCRRITDEIPVPRVYTRYEEMLACDDIDAVSIALPNFLHAPAAIAALEAGKHVLIEKPLAMTAEEGKAMVDAARRTGRKLMICFNYRFRGDSQAVKRQVEAGTLGEVYYTRAGWLRQTGIPGIGSWFTDKSLSGGGPLIDLGVHVLDLAVWLMGSPEPISASGSTYAKFGPRGRGGWGGERFTVGEGGFSVEDMATGYVRFANGATLSLEVSWASFTSHRDDYYVHLFGDEGGIELNVREYGFDENVRLFHEVAGVYTESRPHYDHGGGHAEAVAAFVDAILEDREPCPSGEDGLRILRIIDALYRSAEAGHEVTIDPA
ncbi:MAG: Gfo/Idh/MocA family oxidoreductase [Anaerolineae bacterium]